MSLSRRQFLSHLSAAAALSTLPSSLRSAESAAGAGPRKRGVALVGLGSYSTHQLGPALRQTKNCFLAGVVTGDPAKGKRWAREYGFSERNVYGYDAIPRIADNPEIEVIYVVTPNGLHAEHTIAAAKAGKDVICEKPMARTAAECDAMIAACEKAGVKLNIGYRLHYEPYTREFIRIAQREEFGPILSMDGANGFRMPDNARPKSQWHVSKELAGGGPLMDMGVYVVQEACMAKAEKAPSFVTAKFGANTRPEVFSEVEETITWEMHYADGAVAHCSSSYANNDSFFRARAKGGLIDLGHSPYFYRGQMLKTPAGERTFPAVHHQANQLDAMITEWREGKRSSAPGEMGRRDMAIIDAIYASANQGGKRVEVASA